MTITPNGYVMFTLGAAALVASSVALAKDNHDHSNRFSVCETSASKMSWSCRFEAEEEYQAAAAACINLGDSGERMECLEEARESRLGNRSGCSDQRRARKDVCELLGENRYDPEGLLDTLNFVEEPDDSNPYFSLEPGHT